jgi:hypothetical protein
MNDDIYYAEEALERLKAAGCFLGQAVVLTQSEELRNKCLCLLKDLNNIYLLLFQATSERKEEKWKEREVESK